MYGAQEAEHVAAIAEANVTLPTFLRNYGGYRMIVAAMLLAYTGVLQEISSYLHRYPSFLRVHTSNTTVHSTVSPSANPAFALNAGRRSVHSSKIG